MVRCTESGVLYGARTNYRLADNKMLSNKNGLKKSMYEHATSGEDQESFNSSPLVATFYNIVRLEDMCPDSPRLASIAKEKVCIGNDKHEQAEVLIAQAVAAHASDD